MSGLMYNIAIWPALTKQESEQFNSGLLTLYSSLAFAIWGDVTYTWRDEKILAALELPSPVDLLRMARLRHLQHLVLRGDGHVWAMLHLDEIWLRLIDADLQWLRTEVPWRVPQTDPRDDWNEWHNLLHDGRNGNI